MGLRASLEIVGEDVVPENFDKFRQRVPMEWVEQALELTGTASIRKRRLPATQATWVVLAMGLFRNLSIDEVVRQCDLALPASGRPVAKSAIHQARTRLGPEPIRWLFERSARAWSDEQAKHNTWRGLSVYGIDGTTLRVADTKDNREHFGGADGGPRGASGYPMLRLVVLLCLRARVIAAASFGEYGQGEWSYTMPLMDSIPDNSLTIVDRNFLGASLLLTIASKRNGHFLIRAKKSTKWRVVSRLGTKDALVEMEVSGVARKKDPTLPKVWRARAIHYQRPGFPPNYLLTSLLDPQMYPAQDVVNMYHERWEIELAYDEIKTHLMEAEETLRSKSPAAVKQELWGVLLSYNLVRIEMARTANQLDLPATRISFVLSVNLIRQQCSGGPVIFTPGNIPKRLRQLRLELARFILPPRRARTYPRAVKIKMSSYPRKRPKLQPKTAN